MMASSHLFLSGALVNGILRVHSVKKSLYKVGLHGCKHKIMWTVLSTVLHKDTLLIQRFGNDDQVGIKAARKERVKNWSKSLWFRAYGSIRICN